MIALIAATLLIIRLTIIYKLRGVIRIQMELLKRPIRAEAYDFRRGMFTMTNVLQFGNFIPVILDLLVLMYEFDIHTIVRTDIMLTIYAISNALSMLLAVSVISRMYRLANQADEVDRLEEAYAENQSPR